MTEEAQEVAEVEDDAEAQVAELMGEEAPAEEVTPEPQAPVGQAVAAVAPPGIPFRKLVIGVTNAGLIVFMHDELTMLEKVEVARQLAEATKQAMLQQATAYNQAKAAGQV